MCDASRTEFGRCQMEVMLVLRDSPGYRYLPNKAEYYTKAMVLESGVSNGYTFNHGFLEIQQADEV